jgi:hypothetical protein
LCVSDIPSQPFCDITSSNQALYDEIKKLFDERPIWFRNSLLARLENPDLYAIKTVLPAVGYLFIGGPWRKCWVRLGYDPRVDNTARKYDIAITFMRKCLNTDRGVAFRLQI